MKRVLGKGIAAGARGAAWAALAFAGAAGAQDAGSVNDYKLPPAPAPAPAPAAGPVDNDHPVAAPTRPAPSADALPGTSPAASTAPRVTLPAAPQTRQQRGERTRSQPASAPSGAPAPAAAATTQAPVSALPSPPAAPLTEPSVAAVPTAMPAEAPEPAMRWWPFAVAALALLGGGVLWRRRKAAAAATEAEERLAAVPAATEAMLPDTPDAIVPAVPANLPESAAPPPPAAKPALAPDPLDLRLELDSLRLSVVFATLSYRLELTNRSADPLIALRVAGDLISAHASLPTGQQLSLDSGQLETKHEVPVLSPGQSVSLKGELRLPLNAVVPLRAGPAFLFAPLARFHVEAADAPGDTRIFTVGQPSERPGGAMQPFRLDLGPQLFRVVEQREVEVSRWLALDGARRAS